MLFVGVDLGGSGTRAALADPDGHVLAVGQGPSGLHGGGGAAGRRQLARGLGAALAPIAELIGDEACAVFAGTRGLSIPGRRDSLLLELKLALPSGGVRVSSDAAIGMWGALAGREGVAVVAGSGSIAFARASDGREGRAGGWGYVLGDDGSGFWVGREALSAYLQVLEGRAARSELSEAVRTATQQTSVTGALGWLYRDQDHVVRLAELAPVVSVSADAGDALAQDIIARCATSLAELAAAAARQLWPASSPIQVATSGGLWQAGRCLMEPFDIALKSLLAGATRVAPCLPPLGGAVLLAMRADHQSVKVEVTNRLVEGLARLSDP